MIKSKYIVNTENYKHPTLVINVKYSITHLQIERCIDEFFSEEKNNFNRVDSGTVFCQINTTKRNENLVFQECQFFCTKVTNFKTWNTAGTIFISFRG